MLRVAIGPQVALPSWDWVGFELARELARYFEVEVFERTVPKCDVLVAVKFIDSQMFNGCKVIYLPVDYYIQPNKIEQDKQLLAKCAAIGCHSHALIPFFRPHCSSVFPMEHHAKYALQEVLPFNPKGFVLWIGAVEHVPFLLKWLQTHPVSRPLVILSNTGSKSSWQLAISLAQRLDVKLEISGPQLNGYPMHPWSPRRQMQLMRQATAALDIKGGLWLGHEFWQQQMKPPTKSQQFVCSGIPFAINPGCESHAYFDRLGFNLASPLDEPRWFSHEYWCETRRAAEIIKPKLTLEAVGNQMKHQIDLFFAN
jgi:hypothetical protein